ncbi:ornithine cyclodeaminase [Rickettsiales bacterium LUAb2]
MIKVISVNDLSQIIQQHTIEQFLLDLIQNLKQDFSNWQEFEKIPRPAFHVKDGVIELMPTANNELFAYKYVNGHPKNPNYGKQTVVATGQISKVADGYPLMISEMTILTALRTAATSALATDLLAKKSSEVLAVIGTGSQSEFQVIATKLVRNIKEVKFYDVDSNAMHKFKTNMLNYDNTIKYTACASAEEAVTKADIITVCTADKQKSIVIKDSWIKNGVHINGLGGDCPGKTELESTLLERAKVIVEFFDQSFIEGEIQNFNEAEARKIVHAELWELINGSKDKRLNDSEITIFDSVGFAVEDFSGLRLTYELAKLYNIGTDMQMIPDISDPKNLFSALNLNNKAESNSFIQEIKPQYKPLLAK